MYEHKKAEKKDSGQELEETKKTRLTSAKCVINKPASLSTEHVLDGEKLMFNKKGTEKLDNLQV